MGLREYEEAISTLKAGLGFDRDAADFKSKLAEAQKLMVSQKNKQKEAYSKMFESF